MICQKCGAQLEEYMVFCDQCGTKVEPQKTQESQEPQPPSKKESKQQKPRKSFQAGNSPKKVSGHRWLVLLLTLAVVGFSILSLYFYNQASYYQDQYIDYLKYPSLLRDAEEQLEEYEDYITFMDKYVRVIPNDDSGLFHRYGCEDLNLDSFWIYNIGAAENHGEPCPKCCGE